MLSALVVGSFPLGDRQHVSFAAALNPEIWETPQSASGFGTGREGATSVKQGNGTKMPMLHNIAATRWEKRRHPDVDFEAGSSLQ